MVTQRPRAREKEAEGAGALTSHVAGKSSSCTLHFNSCTDKLALESACLWCHDNLTSMKVGASLSCSGTARGERVSNPLPGRCTNALSIQMVLTGPGHLVHYRQSRLGRTGQRFVKSSLKNMYSSRNERRGVLKTVSTPVQGFLAMSRQNAFGLLHTLTFHRTMFPISPDMLHLPGVHFSPSGRRCCMCCRSGKAETCFAFSTALK